MSTLVGVRSLFRAPAVRPSRRRNVRPALEQFEKREVLSVTYGGGPLLTHVDIEAVFYGKQWSTDPSLQQEQTQIDNYLKYITNSTYMDLLKEYSVSGKSIGHGSFLDSKVLASTLPSSVDDTQIQSVLSSAITHHQVQAPDANRLYFVFVAPGTEVTLQGQNSVTDFLGYHNTFNDAQGHQDYYAVIPYQASPNAVLGGTTEFQSLTVVSSHELAEAVTDPDTNTGWRDYNNTGGEIGDLAEDAGAPNVLLNGYLVQQEYSNKAGGPVAPVGGVIQPGGPTSSDISLTAQNLTATAGKSFSGTLALGNDPDIFDGSELSVTVDWGDGSTPSTVSVTDYNFIDGSFSVKGKHTYTKSGTFTVTVSVSDDVGNQTSVTDTATVKGATGGSLSATGQNVTATAGQSFSGAVALVKDTDPSATAQGLTATINWGDGSAPVTVHLSGPDANGNFTVAGTHTFTRAGTDTITITVQDAHGNHASTTSQATVQAATGGALSATGSSGLAVAGEPFLGAVAVVRDSDPNISTTDLKATIKWGDGSPAETALVSSPDAHGAYQIIGTYNYSTPGTYTLTITVTDADGHSVTTTASITVQSATSGTRRGDSLPAHLTAPVVEGPLTQAQPESLLSQFGRSDQTGPHGHRGHHRHHRTH